MLWLVLATVILGIALLFAGNMAYSYIFVVLGAGAAMLVVTVDGRRMRR